MKAASVPHVGHGLWINALPEFEIGLATLPAVG